MTTLNSFKEIESIEVGTEWKFKPVKARYWWTLLFGFLTGDLNPVHINPFSLLDYKKKTFKKLARHGVSTLSESVSYIFKVIDFSEPTEIIAKGWDRIRLTRPVLMGDKISYQYKVKSRKLNLEKNYAEVLYEVTATNQDSKLLMIADFIILYFPVELNEITVAPLPLTGMVTEMSMSGFIIFSIVKIIFIITVGFIAWKYNAIPDDMTLLF